MCGIIIILGLPGSGKSYFARTLSEKISASYINSDVVRKNMGALGKYSSADRLSIYREMVTIAARLLPATPVIIDATFSKNIMRDLFISLARQQKVSICFMHIVAAEDLIRNRINKSRENSEADFTVYQKIKAEFDTITEDHLTLESTDSNIEFMIEKALEYMTHGEK